MQKLSKKSLRRINRKDMKHSLSLKKKETISSKKRNIKMQFNATQMDLRIHI